ncbi:MAG: hypothetical protein AAGA62_04280, partial [Bacteroidota bacterium]
LSFANHQGKGEGRVSVQGQLLPTTEDSPLFLLATKQSDGVRNCAKLTISRVSGERLSKVSLREIGLDSLFERIFPPEVWAWKQPLRKRLLPLSAEIIHENGEIELIVRGETGNFSFAESIAFSLPEGALYEDIFLWELEDDAQARVLASGEKRLRFIWEAAEERFLPLE